jgi:hypothetical protein
MVVLVFIVGGVWLFFWLKRVATPIPGEAIAGPDTVELVVLAVDPDDSGMSAFVRELGHAIDRDRPGAIDSDTRDLLRRFGKDSGAEILEAFLPISFARASSRGPLRDEKAPLTLVSFSRYANLIRLAGEAEAGDRATQTTSHGDTTIYHVREGGIDRAIAFVENHLVTAGDAKEVSAGLGRIEAWKGSFAPTGLLEELRGRLSARPDLYGLLVNKADAAIREFGFLEDLPVGSADVRGIAWELDILSAERALGHFHLLATDANKAAMLAREFEVRSQEVVRLLKKDEDVEARLLPRADENWAVVDFELADFTRRAIRELARGE